MSLKGCQCYLSHGSTTCRPCDAQFGCRAFLPESPEVVEVKLTDSRRQQLWTKPRNFTQETYNSVTKRIKVQRSFFGTRTHVPRAHHFRKTLFTWARFNLDGAQHLVGRAARRRIFFRAVNLTGRAQGSL